jgi:septal ring factor EnvC (AmiA/AmiB activator)
MLMVLFCTGVPAQKNNRQRKPAKKAQSAKTAPAKKKAKTATTSLPSQKEQLQKKKKEVAQQQLVTKKRQQELELQVKKRMQDVEALSSEIDDKNNTLNTIRTQISGVSSDITLLDSQLVVLQAELEQRRQHYIKSVRYMYRNRNLQSQAIFILGAKNFNQMYRRARFLGEYTAYQRAQGEAVRQKSEQVAAKLAQLGHARSSLDSLLAKGQQQHRQLQLKQQEQQQMVASLKKEQVTVKKLISQQQQQEADLDRQIDRIVALELERARKAEEERLRKKEQERIAAEKAKADKARAQKRRNTAGQKASPTKNSATSKNSSTAKNTTTARNNRNTTGTATKKSTATATTGSNRTTAFAESDADRKLSRGFVSNKGRLPVPITGSYRLVRKFGSYSIGGVTLVSNGIQLEGKAGAKARCIFDGEVSSIINPGGGYVVMVRHGRYITVYGNLSSVSVSKGQRVKTNQVLGAVGKGCILVFRLQNWRTPVDPRPWLGGI